jgi:hypothetical protein
MKKAKEPKAKTAKDLRKEKDRETAELDAPKQLMKVPKPADVGYWGPSSAMTLAACPSWIGEPREDQDTTAADVGTLKHKACEYDGAKEHMDKLEDDADRADVQMCVDYVATLKKPGDVDHKEVKWPITLTNGVKRNGIIDRLLVHKDKTADAIDFKFGAIPVTEAETNRQGWCYVIETMQKYKDLKMVRVHFLQPKLDAITICEFTRKQAGEFEKELTIEYNRTQLPPEKRPHIFGPQCQYCGRMAVCPATAAAASRVAQTYDIDAVPEFKTRPSETVDPKDFTSMFAVAQVLGKWASSVKEHTKQFILAGHEVPGLKLAERAGSTQIPDDQSKVVYDFLKDEVGWDDAQILNCFSAGYSKILDAYADGKEHPAKAKAELIKRLEELGVLVYGTTSFYPKAE